jgi:NAD(P)-dependent dehydrogenase (short-subunit alcohol dehydrogenase family)
MRLSNKTVLVTGGANGVGYAAAKLFVTQGARVALTGHDSVALRGINAELGDSAMVLKGDVRSVEDMCSVVAQVKDRFGDLDAVFANAYHPSASLMDDGDQKVFRENVDARVKGTMVTLEAVLPRLRRGSSFIMNTSFAEPAGHEGAQITGAAKTILRSLAQTWSFEFRQREIRFNAIATSTVGTPAMARSGMADRDLRNLRDEFAKLLPTGSWGEDEDMAFAALYLASDASSCVVGTELIADG